MCLLAVGSIPDVGSSSSTNLESPINAIASESFLFYPPERFLARAYLLEVKFKSSRSWFICALTLWLGVFFKLANNIKCSSTVKFSKRTSCYGHTPIISWRTSKSRKASRPKVSISPDVASTIPVIIYIVVVFPAPLCPKRANI